MPVKITSNDRLTAIQLSAPPITAAPAPASAMLSDHRDADAVAEDRRRVAAEAGQGADAQEQLAGAAEDDVEGDGVGGEQHAADDDAHHRARVAVAQRHQRQQARP